MFRTILPLALRHLPKFSKATTFALSYYLIHNYTQIFNTTKCYYSSYKPTNQITQIVSNIIRVQYNGQFVGYAFCFQNKFLVSTSPILTDNKYKQKDFSYFIGDKQIKATFKIIGNFQNLTFIQTNQDILEPLYSSSPNIFTSVEIIQKRTYLSIKGGYYVAKDSGFGIVDGKGQIGSLVVNEKGVIGIVTRIGRDSDRGFLRMIFWNQLKNAVNRIKQKQSLYLGISAQAIQEKDGIMIVRLASNSPLQSYVSMGSKITKVNQIPIKHPDDLFRIIMFSDKNVLLTVETDNVIKDIQVII